MTGALIWMGEYDAGTIIKVMSRKREEIASCPGPKRSTPSDPPHAHQRGSCACFERNPACFVEDLRSPMGGSGGVLNENRCSGSQKKIQFTERAIRSCTGAQQEMYTARPPFAPPLPPRGLGALVMPLHYLHPALRVIDPLRVTCRKLLRKISVGSDRSNLRR